MYVYLYVQIHIYFFFHQKEEKDKNKVTARRVAAEISDLARGRATKRKRKREKRRVAKRNRVLADFSQLMKFIRAFVSAFGFALRKKAWKEGKWVDAVCQREAPARVNVCDLLLWLQRAALSLYLPFRNLLQSACPTNEYR